MKTAYGKTKTLMVASGWTEFVFIACAWRDVAKNLLEDPPENVMILTRYTLTQQFGCLGAIVETVHLRDEVLAPATGDDDDDDDDDDEEEGAEQLNDEEKREL